MQEKLIQQRAKSLFNALKNKLEMCVLLDKDGIVRIVSNMSWRKNVSDRDLTTILDNALDRLIEENIANFDDQKFILKSLVHDDNVYMPRFNR